MRKAKKLCLVLTFALVLSCLCSCGDTSSENEVEEASDYATKENPADTTEINTVVTDDGTFSFDAVTYVGDDALDTLVDMGEDANDYEQVEDGFKLLLIEYSVTVEDGYEDEPLYSDDVLGGSLWDDDYSSIYDYYVLQLYENASMDYMNVEVNPNETAFMYIVYEIPQDVTSFRCCLDGQDREYWFIYNLE